MIDKKKSWTKMNYAEHIADAEEYANRSHSVSLQEQMRLLSIAQIHVQLARIKSERHPVLYGQG